MRHSAGKQYTANLKQHEDVPDDGRVWLRHVVLTETRVKYDSVKNAHSNRNIKLKLRK
jgi:hypothetical protein